MKLYELAQMMDMVINGGLVFDEETGEVLFDSSNLDELEAALDAKIEACCIVVKETEAEAEAIKAEEKRLKARRGDNVHAADSPAPRAQGEGGGAPARVRAAVHGAVGSEEDRHAPRLRDEPVVEVRQRLRRGQGAADVHGREDHGIGGQGGRSRGDQGRHRGSRLRAFRANLAEDRVELCYNS